MFRQLLSRNLYPVANKLLKAARAAPERNFYLQQIAFKPTSSDYVACRFYTANENLEKVIVSFDQVKNATVNNNSLIIDVREPDEIKEHGKIPNSINIPLGNVSSALSTMPDKEFEQTFKRPKPTEDTEIIFYCMIGKRSGMAQQNALNLGYKKTFFDWLEEIALKEYQGQR